MGEILITKNPDGTANVQRADADIVVSEELLQNIDPNAGHISMHIAGGIEYRLSGYNPFTKTYVGTRVYVPDNG